MELLYERINPEIGKTQIQIFQMDTLVYTEIHMISPVYICSYNFITINRKYGIYRNYNKFIQINIIII